jgi:thymidylate synthase
MATLIRIKDGFSGYREVVQHVLDAGHERSPRGRRTIDLGCTTIVIADPRGPQLPLAQGRGIHVLIAAAEAIQLVGGLSDPELTVWASPNFAQYREENGYFHGAYGPRVFDQVPHVIRKLTQDPQTRQAVITLWNPLVDNDEGKLDYPCTVALGFDLDAAGRLHMNTIMRSNDVWLGFPYDIFQFTQLQLTLATLLGLDVGTYTHTAWSLHIYEPHWLPAREMLAKPRADSQLISYTPGGFGKPGMDIADVRRRIRMLLGNVRINAQLTESELWYSDILDGYINRNAT